MSVYNSMNLKFPASTKNSNMYCALLRRHKALLLSMWPGVLFWVSLIILTGVWASIGVTQPPFLCTLVSDSSKTSSRVREASVTWHYQEHDISQWIQDGHGWSLGVEQIPCLFPSCSSCNPSPPPQLSSLAVRMMPCDDSCGRELGVRLCSSPFCTVCDEYKPLGCPRGVVCRLFIHYCSQSSFL